MAVALSPTNPAALREAQRRLQVLEQQAARHGINVPPEIATEIDDLRRGLKDAIPADDTDRFVWFVGMLQQYQDHNNALFSRLNARMTAALTIGVITFVLVLLLLSRAVFVAPAPAGFAQPAITTPIAGAGAPTGAR